MKSRLFKIGTSTDPQTDRQKKRDLSWISSHSRGTGPEQTRPREIESSCNIETHRNKTRKTPEAKLARFLCLCGACFSEGKFSYIKLTACQFPEKNSLHKNKWVKKYQDPRPVGEKTIFRPVWALTEQRTFFPYSLSLSTQLAHSHWGLWRLKKKQEE